MKPIEAAREAVYPLTQPTLAVSIVAFSLLVRLATAAGLLGLWLAVVVVPALFRFLLSVAEGRIYAQRIEPPGIEKFNWIASPWALVAMLWFFAAGWIVFTVAQRFGPTAAVLLGGVLLCIVPAPIAMLALSRSALASINPFALVSLVRACGFPYLWIPLCMAVLLTLFYAAHRLGIPRFLIDMADIYLLFVFFSLTGAVVARSEAVKTVEFPTAEEPEPERVLAKLDQERMSVLNHAYGLISRGSRASGLAHIEAFIERGDFVLEDYAWFFDSMLRWEQADPALFFAQRYLTVLLDRGQPQEALKVLSRCGLENPRFRPAAGDRRRLQELIEAHDRADLRKLLA